MKTKLHTIHFTDSTGAYVTKRYFTRAGLLNSLKRELKRISIKRSLVTDPSEIKRLDKAAKTVNSILEVYDEKSDVNRGIEKSYETR